MGAYVVGLWCILSVVGTFVPGNNTLNSRRTEAESASQFHFVANDESASVYWFDAGGYGWLSVSRGGPAGNPQTFLYYYTFDSNYNLLEAGYGPIPNGDFSGGGGYFRLDTNTSTNPDMNFYAGSGGQMSVDWRVNRMFSIRSSGINQYTYSWGRFHSQGTYTSESADATGSLFGTPIASGASASIGTNRNVSIDIFH